MYRQMTTLVVLCFVFDVKIPRSQYSDKMKAKSGHWHLMHWTFQSQNIRQEHGSANETRKWKREATASLYLSFAAERCSRGKHRADICIHTVSIVHTDVGPRAVVIVLSADGELMEGEFYDVVDGNSDFPNTVRVAGVLQRVGRRREWSFIWRLCLWFAFCNQM